MLTSNFTYLLINIAILLGPVLLSFDNNLRFFSRIKRVIVTILIGGVIMLSWDILATYLGHWEFNSEYVIGIKLVNLPIEEVLFFLTSTYALIFIYDVVRYYLKHEYNVFDRRTLLFISTLLLYSSLLFTDNQYTSISLFLLAVSLAIATLCKMRYILTNTFWSSVAISVLPFLLFNYILTSIPIVLYSSTEIIGVRIGTIPVEDLVFNTVMLVIYIGVYRYLEEHNLFS